MPPARKLVTHIGTDSCGGQRRHVCPEVGCGASFVKRAHLRRHEMTHTSQRDFICPGCGRAFSRNDSMERHLRRKHFELYRNRTRPKSLPSTHDGTTSIAVDLDRSHLSGTPTDSREDSEDDGPSGYSSELTCTTNQVGNTQIHYFRSTPVPMTPATALDGFPLFSEHQRRHTTDPHLKEMQAVEPYTLRPSSSSSHPQFSVRSIESVHKVFDKQVPQPSYASPEIYQHPHSSDLSRRPEPRAALQAPALRVDTEHTSSFSAVSSVRSRSDVFRPPSRCSPLSVEPFVFPTAPTADPPHLHLGIKAEKEKLPQQQPIVVSQNDYFSHQPQVSSIHDPRPWTPSQAPESSLAPDPVSEQTGFLPFPVAIDPGESSHPMVDWFLSDAAINESELWRNFGDNEELTLLVEPPLEPNGATLPSLEQGINAVEYQLNNSTAPTVAAAGDVSSQTGSQHLCSTQLGLLPSGIMQDVWEGLGFGKAADVMREMSTLRPKPDVQLSTTGAPPRSDHKPTCSLVPIHSACSSSGHTANADCGCLHHHRPNDESLDSERLPPLLARNNSSDSVNLPSLTESQLQFLGPDPWNASLTRFSASQGESIQDQDQPNSQRPTQEDPGPSQVSTSSAEMSCSSSLPSRSAVQLREKHWESVTSFGRASSPSSLPPFIGNNVLGYARTTSIDSSSRRGSFRSQLPSSSMVMSTRSQSPAQEPARSFFAMDEDPEDHPHSADRVANRSCNSRAEEANTRPELVSTPSDSFSSAKDAALHLSPFRVRIDASQRKNSIAGGLDCSSSSLPPPRFSNTSASVSNAANGDSEHDSKIKRAGLFSSRINATGNQSPSRRNLLERSASITTCNPKVTTGKRSMLPLGRAFSHCCHVVESPIDQVSTGNEEGKNDHNTPEEARRVIKSLMEGFHQMIDICSTPCGPDLDEVRQIVPLINEVLIKEAPIYHGSLTSLKDLHAGEEKLAFSGLASLFGTEQQKEKGSVIVRTVFATALFSVKMQGSVGASWSSLAKCFLFANMHGLRAGDIAVWEQTNRYWGCMTANFWKTSWRKLDPQMDKIDGSEVRQLRGSELHQLWSRWYKNEHLKRSVMAMAIYDSQQSAYFTPSSPPLDVKATGRPSCQFLWGSTPEACPDSLFFAWPPEVWAAKIGQSNSIPSKGATNHRGNEEKLRPIATELCETLLCPHVVPLIRLLNNLTDQQIGRRCSEGMEQLLLQRSVSVLNTQFRARERHDSLKEPRLRPLFPNYERRASYGEQNSSPGQPSAAKPALDPRRMLSQYYEYALLEAIHGAWMADTAFYPTTSWGVDSVTVDESDDDDADRDDRNNKKQYMRGSQIHGDHPSRSFFWLPGWRQGRKLSRMEVVHALVNWSSQFSGSTWQHYRRMSGSSAVPVSGTRLDQDTFYLTIRWQAIFLVLCAPLESICFCLGIYRGSSNESEQRSREDEDTGAEGSRNSAFGPGINPSRRRKIKKKQLRYLQAVHAWAHSTSGRRALAHAASIIELYQICFRATMRHGGSESNGIPEAQRQKIPPVVAHAVLSAYAVIAVVLRLLNDDELMKSCDKCEKTCQLFGSPDLAPLNPAEENMELLVAEFGKHGDGDRLGYSGSRHNRPQAQAYSNKSPKDGHQEARKGMAWSDGDWRNGDPSWVWFWHLHWELVGAAGIISAAHTSVNGFHDWMQMDRRRSLAPTQPGWKWSKTWASGRRESSSGMSESSPLEGDGGGSPKGTGPLRRAAVRAESRPYTAERIQLLRRQTVDGQLPSTSADPYTRAQLRSQDGQRRPSRDFGVDPRSIDGRELMDIEEGISTHRGSVSMTRGDESRFGPAQHSRRNSTSAADDARRMRRWIMDGFTELARFGSLPLAKNRLQEHSATQAGPSGPSDTVALLRRQLSNFRAAQPMWCFAEDYIELLLGAL